jgi:hypothetical protein
MATEVQGKHDQRRVGFANEDGHAFSLTDEPFERVPQDGPDLTAGLARAHEDLPFVWWVTDQVMRHDRRLRFAGRRCLSERPDLVGLGTAAIAVPDL